jgi:hypothetical protein
MMQSNAITVGGCFTMPCHVVPLFKGLSQSKGPVITGILMQSQSLHGACNHPLLLVKKYSSWWKVCHNWVWRSESTGWRVTAAAMLTPCQLPCCNNQ